MNPSSHAWGAPYVVEAHYPEVVTTNDGWIVLVNDRLEYCRGFLAGQREVPLPRHGVPRRLRRK